MRPERDNTFLSVPADRLGNVTEARLARLARRQLGMVTSSQARAAGLSRHQIARRLASGLWVSRREGVYRWGGAPETYEQTVLEAVLAAGDRVVASHATAAHLWGLGPRPSRGIDLLGPRGASLRLRGVVAHTSSDLGPVARAKGVPVTSAARTLVDLSGGLTPDRVGELVDHAARRGLLTVRELEQVASRLGRGRGRGLTIIREALALRVPGSGPGDSELEKRALRFLAAAGLPLPVQLHRVVIEGEPFEIDLAYPEARIAIEMDGFDAHQGRRAFDRDRFKTRRLATAGWLVLPFTSTSTGPELVGDVTAGLVARAPHLLVAGARVSGLD